jgi:hypothetical protein
MMNPLKMFSVPVFILTVLISPFMTKLSYGVLFENSSLSETRNLRDMDPAYCENLWQETIKNSRVGNYDEYLTTTTVQSSAYNHKMISNVKTTITKVTSDQVVSVVETKMQNQPPTKSESKTDKKTYIENCLKGFNSDPNSTGKIEIIEQRNENLTIALGTFNCQYQKIKMTNSNGGGLGDFWMTKLSSGYPLNVKSKFEMIMGGRQGSSGNTKMIMERELINYRHE